MQCFESHLLLIETCALKILYTDLNITDQYKELSLNRFVLSCAQQTIHNISEILSWL